MGDLLPQETEGDSDVACNYYCTVCEDTLIPLFRFQDDIRKIYVFRDGTQTIQKYFLLQIVFKRIFSHLYQSNTSKLYQNSGKFQHILPNTIAIMNN